MKLATKLTLNVLVVTLVITPLLAWMIYARASGTLEESLHAAELHAARRTMELIDRTLREAQQDARELASDEDVQEHLRRAAGQPIQRSDEAEVTASLARKTLLTGPWDLLLILTPEGRIAAGSEPGLAGPIEPGATFVLALLREALAGKSGHSDLVHSVVTGKPGVLFAAPVRDELLPSQPIIGAIVGYFAWPVILQILDDVPAETAVTLFNGAGKVIGTRTPERADILVKEIAAHPSAAHLLMNAGAREHSGFDTHGTEQQWESAVRQTGYLSYTGNGWGLLYETPTRKIAASVRALAREITIVVASMMALLGAAFHLVGRRATKPLGELAGVVAAFADGDLEARAKVRSRDEAGVLGAAFNQMAEQIQSNTVELEERVCERTSELGQANAELRAEIVARQKTQEELATTHKQLLETSRQAGMAEVATSVLHNVGNVLNSVNISATVATDTIRRSCAADVSRIAGLLQEHRGDLPKFLTSARGSQLPDFLTSLGQHLGDEQRKVLAELQSLGTHIDHIKEIVEMQQTYARRAGLSEELSAESLVEDALRLNAAAFDRHGLNVLRDFAEAPLLEVDKHKALQILTNLIRNAKHAMDDPGAAGKQMTVRISREGAALVQISVSDQGVGIPAENLTRIFAHGFTTRKKRPRLWPAQRRARRAGNGRIADRPERRRRKRCRLHPRAAHERSARGVLT